MIEELKNINTKKSDIKSFGFTIGVILFLITCLLFYYEKESYKLIAFIASIFIITGATIPIILKPIYIIWMTFAVVLGWVMTRVILSLVFYLILTPISLLTKIFGEDFLGLKEKDVDSYWNLRNSVTELNQDYEKQF